jgi:hypothetical protein
MTAAALAATAAPASAATKPVRIDVQRSGGPVSAAPLLRSATATLDLSGKAQPRTTIHLSARCLARLCTATTTANRKGRWRTQLSVITRRTATSVRVDALYPVPASPQLGDWLDVELSPATSPRALAPQNQPSPDFAMFGDSLAEGTARYMPALLPDFRVTTTARIGRPLLEGMNLFEATPLPRGHPLVLAFSLFTNDHPLNATYLEQAVRRSVERAGSDGCVIWATIVRPKQGAYSYKPVNALLERLNRELADHMELVPWARAVRSHPRWLARRDRVHATPAGYEARAQLYAQAARRCAEQLTR